MSLVQENVSLKSYNTFGIDSTAKYFTEVVSVIDLQQILKSSQFKPLPKLIIGGGSNILFTRNFDGLVIRNSIKGINIVSEDENNVFVQVGAGELWHEFVLWSIAKNLGGVENLSLIPGCVGAGPMQNIGAYGVELKDVFHELEAINITTADKKIFSKAECKFGYRESVFKNECKEMFVITSVTLKLNKKPDFNTSYGAIEQELKKSNVTEISVKAISDAVIAIRKSKLPDPALLGNAGSFFKNPEISKDDFVLLQSKFPSIPNYPAAENKVKLAAGWLIEQCGWKGKRVGNTGSHRDQALVLVNYGNASGNEIFQLALEIQKSVKEKFGVTILPEVNLI
jgi:UDP-N-acetylmuramate dehydrogenase